MSSGSSLCCNYESLVLCGEITLLAGEDGHTPATYLFSQNGKVVLFLENGFKELE